MIRENTLYIKVDSAPLRNELSNNRKVILEKFKAEHKYITEIFFI